MLPKHVSAALTMQLEFAAIASCAAMHTPHADVEFSVVGLAHSAVHALAHGAPAWQAQFVNS